MRGRGSGYLEGPLQQEANVDLMVAVTSGSPRRFVRGVGLLLEHLQTLFGDYVWFCRTAGLRPVSEKEPLFCLGEVSPTAVRLLRDLRKQFPHPHGPLKKERKHKGTENGPTLRAHQTFFHSLRADDWVPCWPRVSLADEEATPLLRKCNNWDVQNFVFSFTLVSFSCQCARHDSGS